MDSNHVNNNNLFRLQIGLDHAKLLEDCLTSEGVEFQSYAEANQEFIKVFVLSEKDYETINQIIVQNEIPSSQMDYPVITTRSVAAHKVYLIMVVLAVTLILLIALAFSIF